MPFGRFKGHSMACLAKTEAGRAYLVNLRDSLRLSPSMKGAIEEALNPQPGRYVEGRWGRVLMPEWLEK